MSGSREAFVAEARKLLDTPWRHLGRTDRFLDCVGLLLLAGWRSGAYGGPDITGYAREPDGKALKAMLARHLDILPVSDAAPGDVACFIGTMRNPCHVGIIGDGPRRTLIHAYAEARKVVEHDLTTRFGGGRLVATYRLPGV